MADDYEKFEEIKRKSLAGLINELSLISNIEFSAIRYSSPDYRESIKKAQKISGNIQTIGDLNNYYNLLQKEIDKREKIYLKGYEFYEVIKKLASKFPDFLK